MEAPLCIGRCAARRLQLYTMSSPPLLFDSKLHGDYSWTFKSICLLWLYIIYYLRVRRMLQCGGWVRERRAGLFSFLPTMWVPGTELTELDLLASISAHWATWLPHFDLASQELAGAVSWTHPAATVAQLRNADGITLNDIFVNNYRLF